MAIKGAICTRKDRQLAYDLASAAPADRGVAGRHFILVGGEGRKHFGLFALRNLGKIEAPPEFGRDLIEFGRRDPQVAVGFLKAERRRAGMLGWRRSENVPEKAARNNAPAICPLQVIAPLSSYEL